MRKKNLWRIADGGLIRGETGQLTVGHRITDFDCEMQLAQVQADFIQYIHPSPES
jgi:hypothetical protein